MTPLFDVAIIGGGIIGLATARELLNQYPGIKLILIEKEAQLAAHQTTHNSGVIHSGIYYSPGSLKAKFCHSGQDQMLAFCRKYDIPHRVCGKLIVATKSSELDGLEKLYQRGIKNGVSVERIDSGRIREIEPYANGLKALHVPKVAVVDFGIVAKKFASLIEQEGGVIWTAAEGLKIEDRKGQWTIQTLKGDVRALYILTAGGLHADRLAGMTGLKPSVRIIPFRGEYYELVSSAHDKVCAMLYPVPNPAVPFLGVHFTKTISGNVEIGPNAVLALKREGYRRSQIDFRDLMEIVGHLDFWRMSFRYSSMGLAECKKIFSRKAALGEMQQLIPDLRAEEIRRGKSGVRAQAISSDGRLVDDFVIEQGPRSLCVLNVPSPAATASIRIAQHLVSMFQGQFPIKFPS